MSYKEYMAQVEHTASNTLLFWKAGEDYLLMGPHAILAHDVLHLPVNNDDQPYPVCRIRVKDLHRYTVRLVELGYKSVKNG